MGRKIDIKKIEDATKCQVTFSKRRTSLIKKANELAVCCGVDVAFVAFSPSGRVSKYSSQIRIEDVLLRYISLSPDRRLNHLTNVQEKLEKLRQIGHIKGDYSKLQFLNKQIENLELQIKKRALELQILQADLRDYEPGSQQEPSLHQLSWCERNLQRSLDKVMARKNELLGISTSHQLPVVQNLDMTDKVEITNQDGLFFASNFNGIHFNSAQTDPSSSQLIPMHPDPWISSYNEKVRDSILKELFDEADAGPDYNYPGPSNTSNFPIAASSALFDSGSVLTPEAHIQPAAGNPQLQSSMADQSLHSFSDADTISWNTLLAVASSDGNQNLAESLPNFFPPSANTRDTGKRVVDLPQSQYYTTESRFAGPFISNFTGTQREETGHMLPAMGSSINFSYGSSSKGNGKGIKVYDDQIGNFSKDNITADKSKVPFVNENELFRSLPTYQDNMGDNTFPSSEVQQTALWEWEDLLLDENFTITDYCNDI